MSTEKIELLDMIEKGITELQDEMSERLSGEYREGYLRACEDIHDVLLAFQRIMEKSKELSESYEEGCV